MSNLKLKRMPLRDRLMSSQCLRLAMCSEWSTRRWVKWLVGSRWLSSGTGTSRGCSSARRSLWRFRRSRTKKRRLHLESETAKPTLRTPYVRFCVSVWFVNGVGHINKVKLRRARLILGLRTTRYSSRPIEPGHPSVRSCNEYCRWFQPSLGSLALARWAGWSAVQVGLYVKCWSRSNDLPR